MLTPKLVPVAPIGFQEEVVEAPAAAALGEDNDGDFVVSVPTNSTFSLVFQQMTILDQW